MVVHMELQEPAKAMMASSCIPPPLPEPKLLQITSTTFEAAGFRLGPQQVQELKVLDAKQDEHRAKAIAGEDWRGLLDYAQWFFWAFSIPVGLARLLCHLLPMCHAPASSKTILAKVLAAGQKKSLKAAC